MNKYCKDCEKELPIDSEFCQYCGSKNIITVDESLKAFKRCIDCGKELPIDSDFCQYCGSKRVAIINDDKSSLKYKKSENKLGKEKYKIPFIICLILSIVLAIVISNLYDRNSKLTLENNELYDNYTEILYNCNTAENKYREINNIYNNIISYARSANGYSDFYARQTILINPKNQKVWVYFGHYDTIYFQCSYNVSAEWGNWSGNWIPITISNNGSGVGYVELSNDYNNEKIKIVVIGT